MDLPEIKDYTLIRPVGHGGMADVYLAMQESFQREVAIKVLSHRSPNDTSFGSRFLREARIASQLSHPNIVPVYDVQQDGDLYYIIMEYLPHGDLKQRFERGIPLGEGLKILTQILSAMQYASEQGFVHRDIKPENILFRNDNFPVLSDFGIARSTLTDTRMTMTGAIMGTPQYMSPEQAQGIPLDGRSDLYSIGVILFELITGYAPYSADSAISIGLRHITEPIPQLPREISDFQRIIDKALAKSPGDRFQNGEEFTEAILNLEKKLARKPQLFNRICQTSAEKNSEFNGVRSQSDTPTTTFNTGNKSNQFFSRSSSLTAASVRTFLILLAGALILIGGGGYLMLREVPTSSPVEDRFDQKARHLLKLAKTAIKEKRYSTPPGDNAQDYLAALLTINPNNPAALQELETLTLIYLDEFKNHLNSGAFDHARELLSKARQNRIRLKNSVVLERLHLAAFELAQQETELRKREQQLAHIEELTSKLEQAWKEKKYFSPPFENPIDLARQLQSKDTTNLYAAEVLQAIEADLLHKINQKISDKSFVEARQLITLIQRTSIDKFRIKPAEDKLKEKTRQQIELLQNSGKTQISKKEFQLAYETYLEIRLLQYETSQNGSLLKELESSMHTEITKLISANKLAEAGKLLDLADLISSEQLSAASGRARLAQLRSTLNKAYTQKKALEDKVADLLTLAKNQTKQAQFIFPSDANSLDTFQQILRIDPANEEATTGLTNTVRYVIENTEDLYRSNQYHKAEILISLLEKKLVSTEEWKKQITSLRNQIKSSKKIQQLINIAESRTSAVSSPENIRTFQQILSLNKDHPYALNKLDKARRLIALEIDEALSGFDFKEAKDKLSILKVLTNSEEARTIQTRIEREELKQSNIRSTVSKINAAISSKNINSQQKAIENFEQVTLLLETLTDYAPAEIQLRELRTAISEHFGDIITRLVQADKLEDARTLANMLQQTDFESKKLIESLNLLSATESAKEPPAIGVF